MEKAVLVKVLIEPWEGRVAVVPEWIDGLYYQTVCLDGETRQVSTECLDVLN